MPSGEDPLALGLVNLSPRLVQFLGEGSFTVPSSQSWVLSGGEGWGGEISAPAFEVRGLLTTWVSSMILLPSASFLWPQTALPALGSREEKATLETAVFPPCWGEKLVSLLGISLKQTPQCYLPSTMLSFGVGGDGHPQSGSLGGWRWWNSAREMILGFPPCWVTILV